MHEYTIELFLPGRTEKKTLVWELCLQLLFLLYSMFLYYILWGI